MGILKKIYEGVIDIMQTFLMAASIFLVIYMFVARPFQVSGESMFPTFKNKEYILTNIIGLKFGNPQRGDVIVFKAPTDDDKDFIKRVIGIAGDRVSLIDGFVYVNGSRLDEVAYLTSDVRTYGGSFLRDGETKIVPKGYYFVMGDNRPSSSDSREWGLLKAAKIEGISFLVYWPLQTFRGIENPYSQKSL